MIAHFSAICDAWKHSRHARVINVEVGPIWDRDNATTVAREYELEHPGTRWTGSWNTTIPGLMSVITFVVRYGQQELFIPQNRIADHASKIH